MKQKSAAGSKAVPQPSMACIMLFKLHEIIIKLKEKYTSANFVYTSFKSSNANSKKIVDAFKRQ